jgi:hypothetical protein
MVGGGGASGAAALTIEPKGRQMGSKMNVLIEKIDSWCSKKFSSIEIK